MTFSDTYYPDWQTGQNRSVLWQVLSPDLTPAF